MTYSKTMKQMSKKDFIKKKPHREDGHWEGKFWCDCRIRNRRKWLGRYAKQNEFDVNEDG